ncbi:MAG: terpene cyclase/mutase family protein [Anaerolineae bacterium]|nr:terpene cyclase/mutase family protein [Anaerolineae bacterium]
MNFERAIAFVQSRGNEVEQARLRYILFYEHPSQKVVAKLVAGQRPDGGWPPFWANGYSSLDATCFRLAQAEQLGISEHETALTRAVHFLAHRQFSDGSWEEDESFADSAPPWAKPGDLSARLYLTANCGLWLAIWRSPDHRAVEAADYLRLYLDQDGHLPGFLHTQWLAAGLWYKLGRHELSELVFKHLSENTNTLATSNLSWLIISVYLAGVSTDHPLVSKAVSLLEQSQHEDGRWSSEDGPNQDVHATLEALYALALCGRVVK